MGLNRQLVFKFAKGYRSRGKNCWRIARLRVEKALSRAFEGRKEKKRTNRALWIQQINAGSREHGVRDWGARGRHAPPHGARCRHVHRHLGAWALSSHPFAARGCHPAPVPPVPNPPPYPGRPLPQVRYGDLMHGLSQHNVQLNRKVLAELAAEEPYSFKALVDQVKHMKGLA